MKELVLDGIFKVGVAWLILGACEALITLWEEGEITIGDLMGNILFGGAMMFMRTMDKFFGFLDWLPKVKIRLPWRKKS